MTTNHSGFYVEKLLEGATEATGSPRMRFLWGLGGGEVAWMVVKAEVERLDSEYVLDIQQTGLYDGLAWVQVDSRFADSLLLK